MPSAQNPSRSLVSDAQGEGLAPDSRETLVEAFDATEDLEPRSGEAFGRYVLLECIGRGGMGLVYAAYDPQLDRRIALKLLRRAEAPDPRARARLLREAQAIARVRHPNVVTVHDAGVIEDRVFIAMELVSGTDLRKWLLDRPPDHRAALALLLQAGRGLAAAHRAGLVHRDFKPGNVLIGDDGLVRVADFGLARSLTTSSADDGAKQEDATQAMQPHDVKPAPTAGPGDLRSGRSLEDSLTHTGATVGTPAYMAPEQHTGMRVDAASDQFAFCVALYEALWGRRPFVGDNPIDLMMRVTEGRLEPPPRGSAVPARVQRAVLRGLSGAPEHRWPDMDTLLAELERGARGTRTGRILALAAVGCSVGLFVFATSKERTELCPEVQPLGETWTPEHQDALRETFERTRSPHAARAHASVVTAIDVWSESWTRARTQACRATKLRGEQSEALLDLRMACYERQRRTATALLDQLARADANVVERAVESLRHLDHPERCDASMVLARAPLPDEPELRAAVDEIAQRLDEIRGLWAVGRFDEGLALAEAAVQRAEAAAHVPSLAEALVQLGILRDGAGHKREAVETLHRAARMAVAANDTAVLADAWVHLVWSGANTGRPEDALLWADYAEVVIERLGRPPRLVAELRSSQGSALWAAGRFDESLAALDEALHLREQDDSSSGVVSTLLVQSANTLISLRRLDEAHERLERARSIALALQGEAHPNLGSIHNTLGVVSYYRGHLDEALSSFERSYAIQESTLGPDHPDVLFALGNVGNLLRDVGRYDEALEAMGRVLELARRTYGEEHREVGTTVHNIASIHQAKGDHGKALELYREALPLREAVHGPDDPFVANTLTGLGEVLIELQRPAEAVEALDRAMKVREAVDPDLRARARTRFALARAVHHAESTRHDAKALAHAALAELQPLTDDKLAARSREDIESWLRDLQSPGVFREITVPGD